jgi:capsular polysaccharide biosynthesis protein
MLIAAAGGSVLALLVAVLREYFDRRLAEPAAAEDILGIPGMGSVACLAPRHPARIRPGPGLSR